MKWKQIRVNFNWNCCRVDICGVVWRGWSVTFRFYEQFTVIRVKGAERRDKWEERAIEISTERSSEKRRMVLDVGFIRSLEKPTRRFSGKHKNILMSPSDLSFAENNHETVCRLPWEDYNDTNYGLSIEATDSSNRLYFCYFEDSWKIDNGVLDKLSLETRAS